MSRQLFLLTLVGIVGCNKPQASSSTGLPAETINIAIPYVASPDRANRICNSFLQIEEGNSAKAVEQLMGAPDEVRPLYEPVHINPSRIGTTRWYFLEKKTESMSDAKYVRVSFDLNDSVTMVEHWGFAEN